MFVLVVDEIITTPIKCFWKFIRFVEHRLPLETVWQQTGLLAFSLHIHENDFAGYEKTFLQLWGQNVEGEQKVNYEHDSQDLSGEQIVTKFMIRVCQSRLYSGQWW